MVWEPSKTDILWSENLIRVMNQDGIWSVPATGSAYKFDHENKVLITLVNADQKLHNRIQIIFDVLGWTVTDGEERLRDPPRGWV